MIACKTTRPSNHIGDNCPAAFDQLQQDLSLLVNSSRPVLGDKQVREGYEQEQEQEPGFKYFFSGGGGGRFF